MAQTRRYHCSPLAMFSAWWHAQSAAWFSRDVSVCESTAFGALCRTPGLRERYLADEGCDTHSVSRLPVGARRFFPLYFRLDAGEIVAVSCRKLFCCLSPVFHLIFQGDAGGKPTPELKTHATHSRADDGRVAVKPDYTSAL
jgi:hypothetical protein